MLDDEIALIFSITFILWACDGRCCRAAWHSASRVRRRSLSSCNSSTMSLSSSFRYVLSCNCSSSARRCEIERNLSSLIVASCRCRRSCRSFCFLARRRRTISLRHGSVHCTCLDGVVSEDGLIAYSHNGVDQRTLLVVEVEFDNEPSS